MSDAEESAVKQLERWKCECGRVIEAPKNNLQGAIGQHIKSTNHEKAMKAKAEESKQPKICAVLIQNVIGIDIMNRTRDSLREWKCVYFGLFNIMAVRNVFAVGGLSGVE